MADILYIISLAACVLLTLVAGAYVAFARNLMHQAAGLLFALLGTAGLFVFLSAEFLAVSQIMVYVGGIMVLMIFGVLLTGHLNFNTAGTKSWEKVLGIIFALGLLLAFGKILISVGAFTAPLEVKLYPSLERIGGMLLNEYLLPFELISFNLLVGLVGAAFISSSKHGV